MDAGIISWNSLPAGVDIDESKFFNIDEYREGNRCPHDDSDNKTNFGTAFYDYELMMLTVRQRIIFGVVVIIIVVTGVLGNAATIYANLTRKNRPLFRISLISLACSDLLIVVFASMSFLAQVSIELNMLWLLGDVLCAIVPFFQTFSILANSMFLVVIAFDRYMAVKRVIKGTWEPTLAFCVTCAVLIWGLAAGISSPMMSSYTMLEFPIIVTDPNNHSIALDLTFGNNLCVGERRGNLIYFSIVFTIVFVPLLAVFIWLNATIAKEIFNRRKPIEDRPRNNSTHQLGTEGTSTDKRTSETNTQSMQETPKSTTNIAVIIVKAPPGQAVSANNSRKSRQIRMFIVVISIIVVFFILRLPIWIFLLIKSCQEIRQNSHWVMNFTFSVLSIANCAINPLMYTFLSVTITFTTKCKEKIGGCCSAMFGCCRGCARRGSREYLAKNLQSHSSQQQLGDHEHGGIYMGK